jgi:hypothetical protein
MTALMVGEALIDLMMRDGRTIGGHSHLTYVCTKLGLASRVQLVQEVARHA